jgi:hypothetical protein
MRGMMKHPVTIGFTALLLILVYGCGKPKGIKVMRHDEPPQVGKGMEPEALKKKMEAILKSPYRQHVIEIQQHVVGRAVTKTEAGTSGFILYLDNGKWVLAYLSENEFTWKVGDGVLSEADKKLMKSAMFGDASAPLQEDVPHANERCDFGAEVSKAKGKRITGISVGERCFNFCFEGGRELDVTLRRDRSGKSAYRVYWEQW